MLSVCHIVEQKCAACSLLKARSSLGVDRPWIRWGGGCKESGDDDTFEMSCTLPFSLSPSPPLPRASPLTLHLPPLALSGELRDGECVAINNQTSRYRLRVSTAHPPSGCSDLRERHVLAASRPLFNERGSPYGINRGGPINSRRLLGATSATFRHFRATSFAAPLLS